MQYSHSISKAVALRVLSGFFFIYLVILLSRVGYVPTLDDTENPSISSNLDGQISDPSTWNTPESWHAALKEQLNGENDDSSSLASMSKVLYAAHDLDDARKTQSLTLEEADNLCNASGLPVFTGRETRKVYDLFLAGTELGMLEIRFNELAPYVDYFVIVESMRTFRFDKKPLHFKENFDRFEKFAHKIIYRAIDFEGMENNSTWDRERVQRNALFDVVFPSLLGEQAANMHDAIVVSDLDEIPKPQTLQLLRHCDFPEKTTIRSEFYYYSFQWQHASGDWHHPQATFFKGLEDTIRPEELRGSGGHQISNASWHCSSCFSTIAEMKQKIESFSHTEYDHPRFKDPAQVVRRVRNGLDLFDRESEKYQRVEDNQDLPQYLKDQKDQFPWLINRDPSNANFIDYFGVEGKIEDMTVEK